MDRKFIHDWFLAHEAVEQCKRKHPKDKCDATACVQGMMYALNLEPITSLDLEVQCLRAARVYHKSREWQDGCWDSRYLSRPNMNVFSERTEK